MNNVYIYYDICKEIEILEIRLMDLEEQLKAARKLCFSGTMPSDPLPVHVPLDKALEQYDAVVAKIREVSVELERKKMLRNNVEAMIKGLEGIEHQVAYKRDIQGKSLDTIAEELGYSYSFISKISSKIKSAKRVQNEIAKS